MDDLLKEKELRYAFDVEPTNDFIVDFIVPDISCSFGIDADLQGIFVTAQGVTSCFEFSELSDAQELIRSSLN